MREKQKIFKPGDKIVIISDYREKEVIEHLRKLGATINQIDLGIGDFICSDRVAIERKAHSDFVSSIIDGRLFEQIEELRENFKKGILIIEGYSNREISEDALKAAIAKLLIEGITLINTKNPYDTAKTIYWIAKKEQSGNKRSLLFKIGKKPKDFKKLQEKIVSSLPGVSIVLSKRLLQHFGSIEKIFTATETELQKVKGIGKILAKRIKKILSEKYEVKN